MNELQALASNLSRVAVYLAVFAAAAVLILAALVALFYCLALVDLLRGGFLYARHVRLTRADPLRVPLVRPQKYRESRLPTAAVLKAGSAPLSTSATHGPRDRWAAKKQLNAMSSEAVAIKTAADSKGGNPPS